MSNTPLTQHEEMHKFLYDPARRGKRATIGPYVFYLNPNTIDGQTVRSHLEYVTVGGGGSFRYPAMPEVWTLTGHTGIRGADELEAMYGALAPQAGQTETVLPFTFEPLFSQVLYVMINSFKRGMMNQMHLYCQFTMELIVLPQRSFISYSVLSTPPAAAANRRPAPKPVPLSHGPSRVS